MGKQEWSWISERGEAVAERDRIQPGQPVVAAGAAEGNRVVVVNQPSTTVGEDRRQSGLACAVLLADAGREPSLATPVWKHAAEDGGYAAASRIGAVAMQNQL